MVVKTTRSALTLIELLVVIGIIGVLIGLLAPAIMRAREAALLTQSLNNLRQIDLATLQFADSHNGSFPALDGPCWSDGKGNVFVGILPYLDQSALYSFWTGGDAAYNKLVPTFLSPLDPSPAEISSLYLLGLPVTNYACNAFAFSGHANIRSQFTDGTSNTIAFSEHYQQCGEIQFNYMSANGISRTEGGVRASFADGGPVEGGKNCGDYFPVTAGVPPVSSAEGGLTFQVRPHPSQCDPRLPNSTSTRGLQIAMFDGSVHVLSEGISPTVFWGLVTPRGGEIVSLDD